MAELFLKIKDYSQKLNPETKQGDLNNLWAYFNSLRVMKGLKSLSQKDWLRKDKTLELISYLQGKNPDTPMITTKIGKGGGTWVNYELLIEAAAFLDADFKLELYKTFIDAEILQWREDGGDEFINLNIAIDAYLPERDGKDNTGIFIQVAKQLKAKILSPDDTWNTASFPQLEKRAKLEKELCNYLRLGMIRNYEHLKEVISKI